MTGLKKKFIQLAKKSGAKNLFKKAWALQRKGSRSKGSRSKKISTRSSSSKKIVRSKMKKSKQGNKDIMMALGGAGYGFLREDVSDLLRAQTARLNIPSVFGEFSDEVTMGVLSWALMRGKIPIIKKLKLSREIGKAGLYIETARLGEALKDKSNFSLFKGLGGGSTPTVNAGLQATVF